MKKQYPTGAVLGFKHLGSTTWADSTCAARGHWGLESTSLLAGWRCMFYFQTEGWSEAAGSVTLTRVTFGLENLPEAVHAQKKLCTPLLQHFKGKTKPLHIARVFSCQMISILFFFFYSPLWLVVNVFCAVKEPDAHSLKSQVGGWGGVREGGSRAGKTALLSGPVSTGHTSPVICHWFTYMLWHFLSLWEPVVTTRPPAEADWVLDGSPPGTSREPH